MSDDTLLSVVVPVFNEEAILWKMATELAGHFDQIVGIRRWEFVIIENGSIDKTSEILERITAEWQQTQTVTLPRSNIGKALRAGLLHSKAPWVHIINIDYWDMSFFAWAWRNRDSYDLFLGSKLADPTLYKASNYRRVLTWGLNAVLRLNFNYVGADTHGPKLLRMDTMLPVICDCIMSRGQFDTELVLRSIRRGLWIAEAPTEYSEYRPARNKMTRKIAQNLWDQIALYKAVAPLPYASSVRFHRYAKEDLASGAEILPAAAPAQGAVRI